LLIDVARLAREYFEREPDVSDRNQLVAFGTSGHRGSSLQGAFNEAHILAITQAICDYRRGQGIDGPLYMGKDTHALAAPAQRTALEVLAANAVETIIQENAGVTPTPVFCGKRHADQSRQLNLRRIARPRMIRIRMFLPMLSTTML
jgi:phosphoglucomutase